MVCVDGLKGFRQAIESVYPRAEVQLCIVHLLRASLNVNWKERKQVAADLKPIYRAATAEQAELELAAFAGKWGDRYGAIVKQWRDNWQRASFRSSRFRRKCGVWCTRPTRWSRCT